MNTELRFFFKDFHLAAFIILQYKLYKCNFRAFWEIVCELKDLMH